MTTTSTAPPAFNPEDVTDPRELLDKASNEIEKLRVGLLFADAANCTLAPEAEQHFFLALAALETASRYCKLAHYAQMKGM